MKDIGEASGTQPEVRRAAWHPAPARKVRPEGSGPGAGFFEEVCRRAGDFKAERVCARYGARNVRVFGSVARGQADEASDIDQPVRSLLDHAGLLIEPEGGCGLGVGPGC